MKSQVKAFIKYRKKEPISSFTKGSMTRRKHAAYYRNVRKTEGSISAFNKATGKSVSKGKRS